MNYSFFGSLFCLIFGVSLLQARTIVIDTGAQAGDEPSVTETGVVGASIWDQMESIQRTNSGEVEVYLRGDFELDAGDVLRGRGAFPVVLYVGDDVILSSGATIDFAASGQTPGAGGASGVDGSSGGDGGTGGLGGKGGRFGLGGSGGLSVPLGLTGVRSQFAITTPGTPAFPGADGESGDSGDLGSVGLPGRSGSTPNGSRGSGMPGGSNCEPQAYSKIADVSGGSGGAQASYAPAIFIENDSIRGFLFDGGNGEIDGSGSGSDSFQLCRCRQYRRCGWQLCHSSQRAELGLSRYRY